MLSLQNAYEQSNHYQSTIKETSCLIINQYSTNNRRCKLITQMTYIHMMICMIVLISVILYIIFFNYFPFSIL